MAWEETAVAGAGIDDTTIIGEAVEKASKERPGEVHVEDGAGWRLVGRLGGRVERSGTGTATKDRIANGNSGGWN